MTDLLQELDKMGLAITAVCEQHGWNPRDLNQEQLTEVTAIVLGLVEEALRVELTVGDPLPLPTPWVKRPVRIVE